MANNNEEDNDSMTEDNVEQNDVLSTDEAEEMTGDNKISNEEHSDDQMDVDTEGTGVDEPDFTLAAWDDEIEPEDRDDLTTAKINFDELTPADREVYLGMVSLREEKRTAGLTEEINAKVDDLIKQCGELKAGLTSESRAVFLDIASKKLKELKS